MTPEQLIASLEAQIGKLTEELYQSEKNVKDFEFLARTWMKSYSEEVPRLKAKIQNLEQVVEELEIEIADLLDSQSSE